MKQNLFTEKEINYTIQLMKLFKINWKKEISTSKGLIAIFAAAVLIGGGSLTYFYLNEPTSFDLAPKFSLINHKTKKELPVNNVAQPVNPPATGVSKPKPVSNSTTQNSQPVPTNTSTNTAPPTPAPSTEPVIEYDENSLEYARMKARDAKRISDVKYLLSALEVYREENGSYPVQLTALVPSNLSTMQTDPLTGGSYGYYLNSGIAVVSATLEIVSNSNLTTDYNPANSPVYDEIWSNLRWP